MDTALSLYPGGPVFEHGPGAGYRDENISRFIRVYPKSRNGIYT